MGSKALIATWWIFLIFMINCYVANLAASTTVSQINDNSSKPTTGFAQLICFLKMQCTYIFI